MTHGPGGEARSPGGRRQFQHIREQGMSLLVMPRIRVTFHIAISRSSEITVTAAIAAPGIPKY
jgi:hypothetical protein